jgi:tRNA (guanine37-N1)-methyltransferase
MRIDILTIFPEMFPPVLTASIVKRTIAKGLVQVAVRDLRDWSRDKHRKVDDRPFGGGPGMVMKPEPFFEAVGEITAQAKEPAHVILLSPQGTQLTQAKARALSRRPWLILLCGHYEGVDERVRKGLAHEEISIGDYVLTCGELPAMVLVDSIVRLLPGALKGSSAEEDSFESGLLEHPQYTRPAQYRGLKVPEVLRSGNSDLVARWRKLEALRKTAKRRPKLLKDFGLKTDAS